MLIFPRVVLATTLIVAASGGVSPPVGIFDGLLSRLGPQVSRLHPRQTLSVPPDCTPICEAFSTTVKNCPTAACACTVQNMNTGFSCVECTVSEIPGEATTGQMILSNFAGECATYGFPLNIPTVTLSGTVVPSATDSATTGTTGYPTDPPTGLPSGFSFSSGSGPTTTSPNASPTSSTTGGKSRAVRVRNKAEVICLLFSVCLTAVLVT